MIWYESCCWNTDDKEAEKLQNKIKKVLDKNESDWYNIWAVSKEASEKQKLNLENERLNSV